MEELPRDAEVCLVPSLCSLQNRALSLFFIQGQNGLCPFSSWQLFLRYCPIHHLGEILPALSGSSEDPLGVTVSDQTRGSGLCQPFCLSLHLVVNLRRTGPPSLCVPHASQAYTKSSSGIYGVNKLNG